MIWYVIYQTSDGAARSYTSILPSPLPAGLSSFQMTQAETDGVKDGSMRWDAATRTVVANPPDAIQVNTTDLTTKASNAVAGNITAIGQASTLRTVVTNQVVTPTAANVSQCNTQIDVLGNQLINLTNEVERCLRQLTAIERLYIGGDLLLSTDGT